MKLGAQLSLVDGSAASGFGHGTASATRNSAVRVWVPLALLAVLFAAISMLRASGAVAQDVTYHGCVDAQGQSVESVADPSLSGVALAGVESGRPVIRHNAAVLPQLTAQARLFFFAHECARHALA